MSHSLPTSAQGRGGRKIIGSRRWQGCCRVMPSRYDCDATLQLPAAVVAHTRPARHQARQHSGMDRRGGHKDPPLTGQLAVAAAGVGAARSQFSSVAWPMIGCRCSSGRSIRAGMGSTDWTQKRENRDCIKFGGRFWGGCPRGVRGKGIYNQNTLYFEFLKEKN